MLLARWKLALLIVACTLAASPGCCARRGYILHGDWSLELNRVPWRGDDCDSGHGHYHDGYADGAAMEEPLPPRSRFHPVPTRDVFSPVVESEPVPTPAPASSQPPANISPTSRMSPRQSQPVPARYSRKASPQDCELRGTCDPAVRLAAASSRATASKPAAPAQPKPKARLSDGWKAVSRT